MEFLKQENLSLNPAGYLVSTETNKPVYHENFVGQQRQAEYIVKLADAIQGKTFKASKVDSLEAIKAEVLNSINAKTKKEYVANPTKPVSKVNDELIQFALDFVKYDEDKSKVSKINEFMAQFDVIDSVETVGDYFTEGVVKLNQIYTIAEILTAVTAVTEKLD